MTVQPHTSSCSRCSRNLDAHSEIDEFQESITIHFRAGYGSVFGDGNVVHATLCQYCVKELLGQWLKVREDDPFQPAIRMTAPRGAYQPHQLEAAAERQGVSPDDLKSLFKQLKGPSK